MLAGKKKRYEVSAVISGKLQKKAFEFPAVAEVVFE